MRGVRFRMPDMPELPWALLPDMAARLAQFGWHAQFQMDRRFFHEREDLLRPLPCTLVCEHIGKFLEPVPLDYPGFRSLLELVDSGRCRAKLSAPI
jgi:D-galactarolactone isomerase